MAPFVPSSLANGSADPLNLDSDGVPTAERNAAARVLRRVARARERRVAGESPVISSVSPMAVDDNTAAQDERREDMMDVDNEDDGKHEIFA